MATYRLVVEYDGAAFSGWQSQPGVRTVQGVLEQALETMLRKPTRIQGAGRTDAGVHALGQVASFEADTDLTTDRLRKGLTALARPDIAIVEAAVAPDGFNARFDAIGKHYQYRILSRPVPSPLFRNSSYFIPTHLDVEKMSKAAELLIGEHDFAGFRSADCERDNTVRELNHATVIEDQQGFIVFDVKGTAFLKNMVRIIAGTLIEVGKRKISLQRVGQILEKGDRTLAGPTAPAHGLTMVEVFYPKGWIRER